MSEPACSSGLMLVTGNDNTLASCARLASKALMQPVECDELSSRARECYIRLLRLVICMSWANGQDPEMVWRAVVDFVETAEYNDLESKAVVEPFAPPTGKTPCPSRFGHGPGKRKNPYELTAEAGAAASTDAAADGSGCVGSTMFGPSLKSSNARAAVSLSQCRKSVPRRRLPMQILYLALGVPPGSSTPQSSCRRETAPIRIRRMFYQRQCLCLPARLQASKPLNAGGVLTASIVSWSVSRCLVIFSVARVI